MTEYEMPKRKSNVRPQDGLGLLVIPRRPRLSRVVCAAMIHIAVHPTRPVPTHLLCVEAQPCRPHLCSRPMVAQTRQDEEMVPWPV
jgi:hypothetical protein